MSNLIPTDAQKIIEKNYRMRRLTVGIMLATVIVVVSAILLVPAYFLSWRQVAISSTGTKGEQGKSSDETAVPTNVVEDTNAKLALLKPSVKTPDPVPDELIRAVLAHVSADDITLQAFIYTDDDNGARMSLQGVAKDRKALGVFANALEADPLFEQVNYPLDALISEQDLKFSLTMHISAATSTSS